jgi:hypothetical protein
MQAPNASPYQPSSLWDLDPARVAEEEIRKYLIAHRVTAQVQAMPRKGHPVLCLLAIQAGLALIIVATLWAVNRVDCDPLITDHGFSRVCRWGHQAVNISGVMPSPGAGDF